MSAGFADLAEYATAHGMRLGVAAEKARPGLGAPMQIRVDKKAVENVWVEAGPEFDEHAGRVLETLKGAVA